MLIKSRFEVDEEEVEVVEGGKYWHEGLREWRDFDPGEVNARQEGDGMGDGKGLVGGLKRVLGVGKKVEIGEPREFRRIG